LLLVNRCIRKKVTMSPDRYSLAEVDRTIHEPARSIILAVLSTLEEADFLRLLSETGLTKGNLSAHLSRLEEAGYIHIQKSYRGKVPVTLCRLTDSGRLAFETYRRQLREFIEKSEQPLVTDH
jgi:DNA-binding transcriptional ArsR family regulator